MRGFILALLICCAVAQQDGYHSKPIVMDMQVHHTTRKYAPKQLDPFRWHHASARKRGDTPTLPTGGDLWPVAIYWSNVEVGSDGKKFPIAIDSGSFTLNIPLKGCQGCSQKPPNNAYVPSESSSSKLEKCSIFKGCGFAGGSCSRDVCTFSNTYETCVPTDPTQPCTITGKWYTDKVGWGGTGPVEVIFGAIDYQTSNFEQFAFIDGVCGMAGQPGPESVIGQLAKQNAIPEYVWSMCINNKGLHSNGSIVIGGVDDRLHIGPIKYSPNTGNGGFYQMQLNDVKVGSSSISGFADQLILDSGTNILLLPDAAYRSMESAFKSMCGSTNLKGICGESKTLFDGACFAFTEAEIAMFPNITLDVTGVSLNTPPSSYILEGYGVNVPKGQYCLGVTNTGPGGLQIVGDTTMQQYLVVFDQQRQQIGWSPVNAANCGNIGGSPE